MRKFLFLLFSMVFCSSYGQDVHTLQVPGFHPADLEDHKYAVIRISGSSSGAFGVTPDGTGRVQFTPGGRDIFGSREEWENPSPEQYYLMVYNPEDRQIQVSLSLSEVSLQSFLQSLDGGYRYMQRLAGRSIEDIERSDRRLMVALNDHDEPYSLEAERMSIPQILDMIALDTGYRVAMVDDRMVLVGCPDDARFCIAALNSDSFDSRNQETLVLHIDAIDEAMLENTEWTLVGFDDVDRALTRGVTPEPDGTIEAEVGGMGAILPEHKDAEWQYYLTTKYKDESRYLFTLSLVDAELKQFVRSLQMLVRTYASRGLPREERISVYRIDPQYLPGMENLSFTLEGKYLTLEQVFVEVEAQTGCRLSIAEHQVVTQYCR